jgi:hypothetical protein
MDDKEKSLAFIFGFLTLLAVINWFILVIIKTSRFFFWFSLLGMLISILSFIYFVISYLREEENLFDLDDESGLIALISIGAIIIFYLFAGACYNAGYSEEALKAEKDDLAYLQDYNIMMNLPYQIIEETIDNNCKDPTYPCEMVKKNYQIYKSFIWRKDKADSISKIMVTAKKIDNSIK